MVNLPLEKEERVTTEGKDRGEAGEVTGVVAYAPTTDGLERRYGASSGWRMAAGKILQMVIGFDVDKSAEA